MSKPLAVAWTGASGLVYGVRLVEELLRAGREVHLVMSAAVAQTAPVELGLEPSKLCEQLFAGPGGGRLRIWAEQDFSAPMASGSSGVAAMAICPCSMGTAGRLAAGAGETLLLRAADVCLKERRPLILVPRETPLSTLHLENLARLSALGAVVLPATPGFYHRPRRVEDLVDFVVQRICDQLGVAVDLVSRWGGASGGAAEG
jgi:4-hydroxy-3-polyprenylbenzoate decarboxylase